MTKPSEVRSVLKKGSYRVFAAILFMAMTALFCVSCGGGSTQTQIPPPPPPPLGVTPLGAVNCTVDGSTPLSQAVCTAYTVNCEDVDPDLLPITATLAVSTPANPRGTIYLQNGSGGYQYFLEPTNLSTSYAAQYFDAGFQVVQVAFTGSPTADVKGWVDSYKPGTTLKPLKSAACRTAEILSYVNTNIRTTGAMCAQGHSAGSSALSYALAWYNASSYLDNVMLTAGPVYADVQQGCQYPPLTPSVTVCAGGLGCDGAEWTDFPQYVMDAPRAVSTYTQPGSNCNNWQGNGGATTPAQNTNWKDMSVTATGAVYNYPQTTLRSFLCSPPSDSDDLLNNSSAQGWLFYSNFAPIGTGTALNFLVHRVDDCGGDEQIWYGTDNGQDAFMVSMNDMLTYCVKNH